jgi:hypothetical protein
MNSVTIRCRTIWNIGSAILFTFCFKPVDKRVRNSIAINALKEGISAWDRDVDRFLNSECVPLYNPVEEYLYETGRWDGKDRIRALARSVAL